MHGSASDVSSNINVLTETFQCGRNTVRTRHSVFNTVIDKYLENIYTPGVDFTKGHKLSPFIG